MLTGTGAVAAALGSAIGYAISSVIQHRTARRAPPGTGLRFGLLSHLAARPIWLIGLVIAIIAFALHAIALSLGELAVIQPLLISGVLFALPASVLLEHRRPSITEWSWAALLVAGIAAFLISAHPTVDQVPSDTDRLAVLVTVGTGLAAGIIIVGQRIGRQRRAALLGLSAGVTYGITAALIKQVTRTAGQGPFHVLTSWSPYALIVIGAFALIVNQAAYQAGPLSASLPAMTMADPVVAIAIGVLVFNEHLNHTPTAVLIESLSTIAVIAATIHLAQPSTPQATLSPPDTHAP